MFNYIKKRVKGNKKIALLLGFIVGLFVAGNVAYATLPYIADEIYFNKSQTNITSDNVQDVIDELAARYANTTCRADLVCIPND